MIYTSIFGFNDTLKTQPVPGDYHAFVQGSHTAVGWQQWQARELFLDQRRNARYYKVLMPEQDCIWIDGNIEVNVPEEELYQYFGDNDIVVHKHGFRDCIYEELEAVIRYQLEDPQVALKQIARYRRDGYPEHNGLAETGVIMRKDTPAVRELNRMWWEEISRGSKRDQLSFNYCCWKLGIKYSTFPDTIRDSKLFTHTEHKR